MTDTPTTADGRPLDYQAALAEVEEIVRSLEGSTVDIDRLTQQVARGIELVEFCRTRLDGVAGELGRIVGADDPDADDADDDRADR